MTQLALLFPPPLTAKQLAACPKLQRLIDERKQSFAVQLYAKNRKAQKRRVRG